MLLDLVDIQRVAGIAHHGFGLVSRLQLAFAVHAKAHGWLLADQPVRHRGLGAGLRVEQGHAKALQAFHQQRHDLVCTALGAGIDHQQLGLWIQPHPGAALLGKGHGQQIQLGFVFELLLFLLAGLAAEFFFDGIGLLGHFAVEHAGGQHLALTHIAQHPMAADAFGQQAMLFATRWHPAGGFFLRRTAGGERRLLQRFFHLFQCTLPLRRNAVHDHVLEHAATSFFVVWNARRYQRPVLSKP